MAKSMTKSDIVNHLADKLGTTKKLANDFLDEFVNLASVEAKNEFTIPGLGKITTSKRQERKGRNPQTGEEITIAAKEVVKFKVSKTLQDAVFNK